MGARSLRGKVAIVGIGETTYYKRGQAPEPEFKLALRAILAACNDAGIRARDIDGFSSYANERSEPLRLATALGLPRLRSSLMQWGGGGAGCCAAVSNAAAHIAAGLADCVVVYRSIAQGSETRFGEGSSTAGHPEMAYMTPYGVISPTQKYAFKIRRFLDEHGIGQGPLRAVALAAYAHAQNNPHAVMYGRPLDAESYDASRWIVEPLHLFDCCQETDGAAALVLMDAQRAANLAKPGAYLLGAALGADYRAGAHPHNAPDYATAGYINLANDCYRMAQVNPQDIGWVQAYENFTGGVVMALIEHGLCSTQEANTFLTPATLSAPKGQLPLNTSGGNLAEGYLHGLGLIIEGVRQIRASSANQALRKDIGLIIGAPLVAPASNLILGSRRSL